MQTEKINLAEAVPMIRDVISAGGIFRLCPHGISMLPTIKEVRDTVSLSAPECIKRGDIVLYERKDGAMILHRVVKTAGNALDICGDNQMIPEKNVPLSYVIAVVSEYTNGEKTIKRGDRTFKKQYAAAAFTRPFKRLFRHFRRLGKK